VLLQLNWWQCRFLFQAYVQLHFRTASQVVRCRKIKHYSQKNLTLRIVPPTGILRAFFDVFESRNQLIRTIDFQTIHQVKKIFGKQIHKKMFNLKIRKKWIRKQTLSSQRRWAPAPEL
jgi:hypothetical protein